MQASLSTSCHMCHTCICLRYMLSAHDKDADNCAQCNLQEHAIVSYLWLPAHMQKPNMQACQPSHTGIAHPCAW